MYEDAEAYEAMMGRWSRELAPLFINFVGFGKLTRCLTSVVAPAR